MRGEEGRREQGFDWCVVVFEDAGQHPDASRPISRTVVAGAFEAEKLVKASRVRALMVDVRVSFDNCASPEARIIRWPHRRAQPFGEDAVLPRGVTALQSPSARMLALWEMEYSARCVSRERIGVRSSVRLPTGK